MTSTTEAPLAGRAAVVTGSARNIGRAIALALAARGADVVIHAQSDRGAATAATLVDTAVEAFGWLDIVICNAAIRRQKPFVEMTFDRCLPDGRYVTGQVLHVNGGMWVAGA